MTSFRRDALRHIGTHLAAGTDDNYLVHSSLTSVSHESEIVARKCPQTAGDG